MSLENVKVGDWIKLQVTSIDEDSGFKVIADCLSFTKGGHYYEDEPQMAFPCEEPAFKERWMMVSDDGKLWGKRKVFAFKNDRYISWSNAETDEEVESNIFTSPWKFAKEIEEKPTLYSEDEVISILYEQLEALDYYGSDFKFETFFEQFKKK